MIEQTADISEQEIEQLLELQQQLEEERMKRLDALGGTIKKLIVEAVDARKASGIEKRWQEDEEYYEGIDDLNRDEDGYMKPRSDSGGLTAKRISSDDARCTAFFNITRQFVDSGAARAGDILLPSNDWNFAIKPTPIPDELESRKDDETTALVDQNGQPISVGDIVKAQLAKAGDKVKKAEIRIKDYLVECTYKREYRSMIDNCALTGTGIIKGPFPTKRRSTKFSNGTLEIVEKIAPASKCVSHWDFYPDPNCGENIQDGGYVVERDYMSARQLRDLMGMQDSGFIDSAIKKVLEEGPSKSNLTGNTRKETNDDDRFEVYYYYGDISLKDLRLMDEGMQEEQSNEEEDNAAEALPAIVAIVNDTVIKGVASPLNNGEFPFDVMVWQKQAGTPFGIGIARQGRTAQKMVLSATRALMDNMGLSAIPMLAFMRSAIRPMDGSWTLHPGKHWEIKESSGVRNINEAIQTLVIPSLQQELMNIIQLGMKMMEDATGVSFLLQGQQGSAPDTVGGMNLLHQNASSLLRRIARNGDDVTISHIKRYHDWLLAHGEDDEEKGDLEIEAIGSTALVERELAAMQLPQVLQLALDPRYEKSPKRVFDEILRAWRFDPSKFDMDEAEKKQLAEQAQQQQPMPQVESAKIRAEVELQKEQIRQQTALQKIQVDTDRDTLHVQAQGERDRITYEAKISELQLKRELEMLKYANQNKMTLDKIKSDLAATAMKLSLQRELSAGAGGEAIAPPIEPPQRAEPGRSFEQ